MTTIFILLLLVILSQLAYTLHIRRDRDALKNQVNAALRLAEDGQVLAQMRGPTTRQEREREMTEFDEKDFQNWLAWALQTNTTPWEQIAQRHDPERSYRAWTAFKSWAEKIVEREL